MSTNPLDWDQGPLAMGQFLAPVPRALNHENVLKQVHQQHTLMGQLFAPVTRDATEGAAQANISFLRFKLENSPEHVRNTIKIDPGVMHGNPVFRGTRIPVYQIIEELADGTRLEELHESFPSLADEKVQAGLDFAIRLLRIYDD